MKIEIKRWDNQEIIICGEFESIKSCLEKCAKDKILLYRADLQGADLQRAYLRGADLQGADLQGADLQGAYLQGADLQRADLQGADLQGADLQGADLRGADLQGADLQGADLQGADLRGADLLKYLDNLYILKYQDKDLKLKAWKYLKNGISPYQHSSYEVGKKYKIDKFNTNEKEDCGEGLNVATLSWCLKDDIEANEFIEVEFQVKDIVAIPYFTDGKFRVKQFKVLRQINREEAEKILLDLIKGD